MEFANTPILNSKNNLRWLYALVLLFFVYILARYIQDPDYSNMIFYGINLGIHEAGHYVVFAWFGEFMSMLGGSLMQCLAPLLAMITFHHQRDHFAVAFCFGWLSVALFDTATYIADAREMNLNLLFGQHDWHYILKRLDLLQYDDLIAMVVRACALVAMTICLTYGSNLVWKMFQQKRRLKKETREFYS